MRIEPAIVCLVPWAFIGLLLWSRIKLKRRLEELMRRCEHAELERVELESALVVRSRKEKERFSKLEHDLRSPISIVLGFSSLLKETIEKGPTQEPILALKSANSICEAARKTLEILAAAGEQEPDREEPLPVEGRR